MDADAWNAKYATAELIWSAGPNATLAIEAASLPPGRALDLACGEGRNAVWLAEQGWRVTAVDFSDVAIDKARQVGRTRGVDVDWVAEDVTVWQPPTESFDLVIVLYLQLPAEARRIALAGAARALASGGTLIVVAHDSANLDGGTGGPHDPAVLYTPDDVRADLTHAGVELAIERADTIERVVDGTDRPALDCLVRARR